MADRQRPILDRLLRRRADPVDVQKLNNIMNSSLDWDGKDLASLSKIQMATSSGYQKKSGASTPVSYDLLRQIANKSEVVNAILRRAVDDTLANGYEFILADGKETGEKSQLEKLRTFFKRPNPDDMGDEWLETMLFDLILFGDAYLELDGSEDDAAGDNNEDWNYGGDLIAIWPIEAETMKIIPAKQLPTPPNMAYVQTINKKTRRFSSEKVLHIAKFKQGRGYGSSPLIPLLEVITGQLNLSNYLNALYTGTLPKTILNVGDISNAEMKAMLGLIEQQLSAGQSPFGLIAINGGSGFNMHRLIDSTREGAQLDLLYYYREEICAVFGIPPMKLGWVQTGKLANPEQQLDAWYDVVESYHNRVSSVINNNILPLLDITDWKFKFISIRPKQDGLRAETFQKNATAISSLRQEAAISINEARAILGLERIENTEADNPFFVSPKLQINQPDAFENEPNADITPGDDSDENLGKPETELTLLDLFPSIGLPEDYGQGAGDSPQFELGESVDSELYEHIAYKKIDEPDAFQEIEQLRATSLEEMFESHQKEFADIFMGALDDRFRNDEVMVGKDIGAGDLNWTVQFMDKELEVLMNNLTIAASVEMMGGYTDTLAVVAGGVPSGVGIAFSEADKAALSFWQRRWTLPALQNTLNGFRGKILNTFDRMNKNGKNWAWASAEMRRSIDPTGNKYPKGFYQRIARTETRRVVESAHISGLSKAGILYVERLVTEDVTTDKDLCSPFNGTIYRVDQATGILPAHPNCRCTMVGYTGTPPDVDTDPLKPIIPQPKSKRALTVSDRTPPQGVRKACKTGIELHNEGLSGDGLEGATVREANAIIRGQPITVAKAKKMIRWWGRNERFLDEPKDSPAWVAALLWGGRAGLSWSRKLSRALEAEE